MTGKKRNTPPSWIDPDDAPELTTAWFEQADLYHGETLIRRGRPKKPVKKVTLNMRVDADIMDALRGMGKGWQTNVNAMLRQWVHV